MVSSRELNHYQNEATIMLPIASKLHAVKNITLLNGKNTNASNKELIKNHYRQTPMAHVLKIS